MASVTAPSHASKNLVPGDIKIDFCAYLVHDATQSERIAGRKYAIHKLPGISGPIEIEVRDGAAQC